MVDESVCVESEQPGRSARAVGSESRLARSLELRRAVLVEVGVALVRQPDEREDRQEGHVRVAVDAIADQVVGGAVRHAEDRIEGRTVALEKGTDLDVGDVVEETTAVRVAAQVAIEGAESARRAAIGDTEDARPGSVRLDARVD